MNKTNGQNKPDKKSFVFRRHAGKGCDENCDEYENKFAMTMGVKWMLWRQAL